MASRLPQNLIQSQNQIGRLNIHYQIQRKTLTFREIHRLRPCGNSHSVTRLCHAHDGFERHAGLFTDAFTALRPGGVLPQFSFRVQRLRHPQDLRGVSLVEAERGPPRLQIRVGGDSFHDVIVRL